MTTAHELLASSAAQKWIVTVFAAAGLALVLLAASGTPTPAGLDGPSIVQGPYP